MDTVEPAETGGFTKLDAHLDWLEFLTEHIRMLLGTLAEFTEMHTLATNFPWAWAGLLEEGDPEARAAVLSRAKSEWQTVQALRSSHRFDVVMKKLLCHLEWPAYCKLMLSWESGAWAVAQWSSCFVGTGMFQSQLH